ncbi:MAG TPA: M14 family zinc carboxypeptidase [Mycobacteriales bacterium]
MWGRRIGAALVAGALLAAGSATAAAGTPAAPAAAAGACSPTTTTPTFRGTTPTAQHVLGFTLGSREATDEQLNRYLGAVDRSSDQVTSGTFARTVTGRPLKYALVSAAGNLSPAKLAQIRGDAAKLRRPDLPAGQASAIERRMPTILWLSANVHGNEAAGGDASLRILYELADRTDCVARAILSHALVGIIPTQNPDGRADDVRTNAYNFDMNRDWFARTQPETSGKLDLLAQYPPQLYMDEHGMGGSSYFFPPNSDPIYHETSDQSVDWINNLYGADNGAAFTAKQLSFETYQSGYDLFYQGYGDSVPTSDFGAAGMTYEVGQDASYPDQTYKHYLSAITSLYAGATHRQSILTGWHQSFVTAAREGRQCTLQPNRVYNPGHTVQFQVPDIRVCGYFLRGSGAKARDLAAVVRRLQQADVSVYRLSKPLYVPDYTAYGRQPTPTTMPAGTYWIPMAQAQKHWIQAMLNEDTYVPFPYFYDVSGWSMPLLNNLDGGYTGTSLHPAATTLPLQRVPAMKLPSALPRIGILSYTSSPFRPSESTGWLRWRLAKDWHVAASVLTPDQVNASTLNNIDVLLTPDLDAATVAKILGDTGKTALTQWVNGGGRYVGWQGGTDLATRLGLSTVTLTNPTSQVPGTLFRVDTAAHNPLTAGVGPTDWVMYAGDPVMRANDPADVVASYPSATSPDWFTSGYQKGAEELGTTAAEVDQRAGTGHVTVFSVEPNFRAFTDGSARLLYDAIVDSRNATTVRPATPAPRIGSAARLPAEQRARLAATKIVQPLGADLIVTARTADAATTARVLRAHGVTYRTSRASMSVSYFVDFGRRAASDPAPWVRTLPDELTRDGATPLFVSAQ